MQLLRRTEKNLNELLEHLSSSSLRGGWGFLTVSERIFNLEPCSTNSLQGCNPRVVQGRRTAEGVFSLPRLATVLGCLHRPLHGCRGRCFGTASVEGPSEALIGSVSSSMSGHRRQLLLRSAPCQVHLTVNTSSYYPCCTNTFIYVYIF